MIIAKLKKYLRQTKAGPVSWEWRKMIGIIIAQNLAKQNFNFTKVKVSHD